MSFISFKFLLFFVVVYVIYLIITRRWQNIWLLVASYLFYAAWDWRLLSLLAAITCLDYFCALKIHGFEETNKRRLFLLLSIVGDLTILGFFKYFNFFKENLEFLFNGFGFSVSPFTLNIILPIGISFYTFRSLSYTIDVYRKEMKPTNKFLDYALFVSFFPELIAGPIERARNLLPQILSARKITLANFYEGCFLIYWGVFQKVFIADNLGKIVDPVFASPPPYNGPTVLLASYAYTFQILSDFSGYSDMARGLGKCMGFDLMVNFNAPYFVTNPREFWRRWHISLSTWLRDYLYIPLGGSKKGNFATYRNLTITMLICGLWHGAAWTFIIWGIYHGILLILYGVLSPVLRKADFAKGVYLQKAWFFLKVIFFFQLVSLGWLIFRSESIAQVYNMVHALIYDFKYVAGSGLRVYTFNIIFFTGIFLAVQLVQFYKRDLTVPLKWSPVMRAIFYFICYYLLIVFGVSGGKAFIYAQF
jgi:alginate O-acetyltransferase complex protein AlgI